MFPLFKDASDKPYGISTEEAQRTYHHLRLGDENFDVPPTYLHRSGKYEGERRWSRPDKRRKKVDVISIQGLMPDMAPYTEENAVDFDRLGWGRKVMASIRPGVQDWSYYLSHTAKRLDPMPRSDETPLGFKRFYDPKIDDPALKNEISPERKLEIIDEVFMSSDQIGSRLTKIRCSLVGMAPSPDCEVITDYRGRYLLEYAFSRKYLHQWPEVDRVVKETFDKFLENTSYEN